MRRLIVNLDEDLDLWLAKQTNQNDTVRKALKLYKGNITTDSAEGIYQSYIKLGKYMKTKFDNYDIVFAKLDKLISYLETRM